MHAQGHSQPAGQNAELFAQQRPGQPHALAGREHAAGALGPSDRPERVAGACAAAAIGAGRRGHRWILGGAVAGVGTAEPMSTHSACPGSPRRQVYGMADNNQHTDPTPPKQTELARVEALIKRLTEIESELRKSRAELVSIHSALSVRKARR